MQCRHRRHPVHLVVVHADKHCRGGVVARLAWAPRGLLTGGWVEDLQFDSRFGGRFHCGSRASLRSLSTGTVVAGWRRGSLKVSPLSVNLTLTGDE